MSTLVNPVHFAKGYPQKKVVNPDNGHHTEIKHMEDVSCVGVTVTGKHGSNYRLSLSCNRKSKKLNLTNLFNSQQ